MNPVAATSPVLGELSSDLTALPTAGYLQLLEMMGKVWVVVTLVVGPSLLVVVVVVVVSPVVVVVAVVSPVVVVVEVVNGSSVVVVVEVVVGSSCRSRWSSSHFFGCRSRWSSSRLFSRRSCCSSRAVVVVVVAVVSSFDWRSSCLLSDRLWNLQHWLRYSKQIWWCNLQKLQFQLRYTYLLTSTDSNTHLSSLHIHRWLGCSIDVRPWISRTLKRLVTSSTLWILR